MPEEGTKQLRDAQRDLFMSISDAIEDLQVKAWANELVVLSLVATHPDIEQLAAHMRAVREHIEEGESNDRLSKVLEKYERYEQVVKRRVATDA